MKKFFSLSILAFFALLLLSGCGEKSVQPTQIDGWGSAGDGEVSLRLPIPKALAEQVVRVEVVVSANDMETITQDLTIDENGDAKGTIRNVPAGLARIVTLNAYDAGGTLIYTGSSRVDVVTGETASVSIILTEVNPSGPFFVYVVNNQSGTVSVIDGALNEVVFSIPGVGYNIREIAISPTSNIAWVTQDWYLISILDLDTNERTGSLNTGWTIYELFFSLDGSVVYLAGDIRDWRAVGVLIVYDTSDHAEIMKKGIGGNDTRFTGMCLSPDNRRMYTAVEQRDEIWIVKIPEGERIANIDVGDGPYNIGRTLDGEYLYVSNQNDGTVSVVNTRTLMVTKTIRVRAKPQRLTVSPNGSLVCVANWDGNSVSIISTSSNEVVATVDVGSHPYQPAITPDNAFAYVTNNGSNTVSVIDLTSYEVTATIPVGNGPMGVAIK